MISRKLGYFFLCYAIFFSIGCDSLAQEDQLNNSSFAEVEEKMNQNKYFFDALRLRTDLEFDVQKRTLYTNLKDIKVFYREYKETEMTLEYVIRDRLHTAIFLNQKNNYLQSMDGSIFRLSKNLTAEELTNQVVSLIGSMYYGADEVKNLAQ